MAGTPPSTYVVRGRSTASYIYPGGHLAPAGRVTRASDHPEVRVSLDQSDGVRVHDPLAGTLALGTPQPTDGFAFGRKAPVGSSVAEGEVTLDDGTHIKVGVLIDQTGALVRYHRERETPLGDALTLNCHLDGFECARLPLDEAPLPVVDGMVVGRPPPAPPPRLVDGVEACVSREAYLLTTYLAALEPSFDLNVIRHVLNQTLAGASDTTLQELFSSGLLQPQAIVNGNQTYAFDPSVRDELRSRLGSSDAYHVQATSRMKP